MAKRVWSTRTSADGTAVEWVDAVTGAVDFEFVIDALHTKVERRVLAYGITQIIADAGALSAGATKSERLSRMHDRALSLIDGTYGEAASINSLLYRAVIACKLADDTPATRAAWREMKDTERRAFEEIPEVKTWIAENRPAVDPTTLANALAKLRN